MRNAVRAEWESVISAEKVHPRPTDKIRQIPDAG